MIQNCFLYDGYTIFTKLLAVQILYNLKVRNGQNDKCFMTLLKLLKDILPEDNELSDHTYDTKKIMRSMSMDYEKINVCSNDCILYQKNMNIQRNIQCVEGHGTKQMPTCEKVKQNTTENKV